MSVSALHRALLVADWPAPGNVRAFTTLRHGAGVSAAPFDEFNLGARCGDAAAAVARNRAELVRIGGLPAAPCWLRQVHGIDVVGIGASLRRVGTASVPTVDAGLAVGTRAVPTLRAGDAEPEADAVVMDTAGVVLAILTADCLPVLLCADDGSEVAAAHAGWRGLAAGVLEATVAAMRTPPQRLLAWLGPAAGPQRYEVGQEVFDAFASRDPTAAAAFAGTRPGHWRVDLYALARLRLVRASVAAESIHGGDLCTISDPQRFYSHRRDGRGGRMASVIWIEPLSD